jgi:hypothetical protein
MELIKQNIEKGRSVYYTGSSYIKRWTTVTPDWIIQHVTLLNLICPGYVKDYSLEHIEYNIVEGVLANSVPHTDEYCKMIYDYCLHQIETTKPYVHGDWVLSNMIITDQGLRMIDWDNLGIYDSVMVYTKLEKDMISAFGKERFERIK